MLLNQDANYVLMYVFRTKVILFLIYFFKNIRNSRVTPDSYFPSIQHPTKRYAIYCVIKRSADDGCHTSWIGSHILMWISKIPKRYAFFFFWANNLLIFIVFFFLCAQFFEIMQENKWKNRESEKRKDEEKRGIKKIINILQPLKAVNTTQGSVLHPLPKPWPLNCAL